MLTVPYDILLDLRRPDGSQVGRVRVEPDWAPAREWLQFQALRRGEPGAGDPAAPMSLRALWHPRLGAPYARGFRLRLVDHRRLRADFATEYFQGLAEEAAASFIRAGSLAAGETFLYLTLALPRTQAEPRRSDPRFTIREIAPPLPLRDACLAELRAGATRCGAADRADIPVLVNARVLEEVEELTRAAGENETGGILVGHLDRNACDDDGRGRAPRRELFIEVTAQIPLRGATATSTRLTFSPEAWTEMNAALAHRHDGTIAVGWWHAHPVHAWCRDCPPERQRDCQLTAPVLSGHDRALHRTAYPRAYSLALLANSLPTGRIEFALFGWRRGLIQRRGFHIVGARKAGAPRDDGAGRPAADRN